MRKEDEREEERKEKCGTLQRGERHQKGLAGGSGAHLCTCEQTAAEAGPRAGALQHAAIAAGRAEHLHATEQPWAACASPHASGPASKATRPPALKHKTN